MYRERLSTEAGEGWVRLYPRGAGSFKEVAEVVDASVESELAKREKAKAAAEADKKKEGKEGKKGKKKDK